MSELSRSESKQVLEKIESDLTNPMKKTSKGFYIWIASLFVFLGWAGVAYFVQLRDGLGATAMGDYISWGLYIASFIFFVATALIGMLISSVLSLIGIKWITPIARIAEMIAISFALMAGVVIVFDMGRPDRLLNVFLHARFQSPILWDVTVVITYTVISILLFLLPLIPDMPFIKRSMKGAAGWKLKIYNLLTFGWVGSDAQYKIVKKSIRVLAVLIVPVALAIHTVTSWLFAMTPRIGWDSTIMGPYYVAGAFVAGAAAVTIAMFFLRNSYKLKDYITDFHFDKMAKFSVLLMLVYTYFTLNEYIVPGYKMKAGDDAHIMALMTGHHALLFWAVQFGGLFIPILLFLFKPMRKPLPAMLISIPIVIGAFFKRYIITVPTLEHPHLPIQNVPERFMVYWPNWVEWGITLGSIAISLLIFTVLAKLFPVMPIWEVAHEKGVHQEDIGNFDENNQPKS